MEQAARLPITAVALLITSRYPVPGLQDWLAREELGPLSDAQTRKLFLRLEKLRDQEAESLALVRRVIGGHPRMLEYLDAILDRGTARLPDVALRLREQAQNAGIDLADPNVTRQEAVERALRIGAGDILLDELLDLVARQPGDMEALEQASVFPRPIPVLGLAYCLAGAQQPGATQLADLPKRISRLAQSSLLTRLPDGQVWVHRWTAESLRQRMPAEKHHESCRRGGEYLAGRTTEGKHDLLDVIEATRLFLAAEEWDRASREAYGIVGFLRNYGQIVDLAAFCRELADGLPEDHEHHFVYFGTEADALEGLGLVREAHQKHQLVANRLQTRLENDPNDVEAMRNLSVAYNNLGDLMVQLGQGEAARGYFQQSLAIRERLARAEPQRADFQRDLSVSCERLGDIHRGLGETNVARKYYEQSLAIWQKLIDKEPSRTDLQKGIRVPLERLGDLMVQLGQGEAARDYFQQSLAIRERLARAEPQRADFQRDLAVSYNKLGDLMRQLGQGEAARGYFQQSLDIRERLARAEPQRADFQRDLSVSYNKLGDLMVQLGQGEAARAYFEKDLAIAERLARAEPQRADFQRDLSVSYNKLGDLMVQLGQGEAARAYFEKDLAIAERLARAEPQRADFQRDLAVSLFRMGDSKSVQRAYGILVTLRERGALDAQALQWLERFEKQRSAAASE